MFVGKFVEYAYPVFHINMKESDLICQFRTITAVTHGR